MKGNIILNFSEYSEYFFVTFNVFFFLFRTYVTKPRNVSQLLYRAHYIVTSLH